MRRSDREIIAISEIIEIINKCDICRLAFSDNNTPYIVPMNFGYEYENNQLTLYFHGAKDGKKYDIIKNNPVACFEMDCSCKLIEADEACKYTMEYESVIGSGVIIMCEKTDEKIHAFKMIMEKYAKTKEFNFPDHALDVVNIFKLSVSEFTGKRLIKA